MSSADKPLSFTDESYKEWFAKSVTNFCDGMLSSQLKAKASPKAKARPKPKHPSSFDMQMTRAVRQRALPASSSSSRSSGKSAPVPVRRPSEIDEDMTSFKKIRRIDSASDIKDNERIIQASDCIELVSGEPSFVLPLCIDCFLAKKRGDKSHEFSHTCRFGKNAFLRWVTMEPLDPFHKGTQRQLKVRGLVTENERMKLDDVRQSHGPDFTEAESKEVTSLFSNNRLDVEAIQYIVSCILPVFKAAVQEEKEALTGFANAQVKTALKGVPNGFRENCDVCETGIFDVHYVCQFCGFSVCLACKKEKEPREQSYNGLRPKPHRKSFFKEEHFKSTFLEVPRDGHYWYACCSNPASPFPASDEALASTSSAYCDEGFPTETFPHHFIPTLILPHKALELFLTRCEKMMERCGEVAPKSPSPPESSLASPVVKSETSLSPPIPDSAKGSFPKSFTSSSILHSMLTSGKGTKPLNGVESKPPKELVATVSKTPITLNGFTPQTNMWLDGLVNQALLHIHGQPNGVVSEALVIETSLADEDEVYTKSVPSPGQQLLHDGGVLWFEPDDGQRVSPGRIKADQCESPEALKDFRNHWKQGLPVVVSGVTERLKRPELWLPDTFKARFGGEKVNLLDCAVKPQKLYKLFTHQSFWDGFDNFDLRKRINKRMPLWKIKDWPTETTFSELLPEHHADLMQALPFNSYSNTTGIYNLASYLPKRCNPPDLGPKMYIAYGAAGQAKLATTNLHLDISDAVNVIVHVGIPTGDGSEKALKDAETELRKLNLDKNMRDRLAARETPGAVWQIYRPQDCDKIRDFIRLLWKERRTAVQRANDDPIHSQSEYLDHELRQRLHKEYGVVGFDILQFEGDAIFIPAGAPHQVWNIHSCIKCAEDFVSPEHVDRCVALTREFRALPNDFENKTDKLQVKNILFHTLKSMVASMKEVDGKKSEVKVADGKKSETKAKPTKRKK